jgi:hypothetical protein
MGNTNQKLEPYMKVDRIVSAEPYLIHVGVNFETGDISNPFKNQVIRIGDDKLRSLVSYSETKDVLEYEFEENVQLKLMKKDGDVVYHIKTNDINYTSKVNDIIRKHWKSISFSSNELDKISTWMKRNE